MSYVTDNINDRKQVNVQGAYERSIYVPSMVSLYFENKDGLKVNSNMWALDNRLTSGDEWRKKNSVLKYGSVYTLSGSNTLKISTYQCIDINNSDSITEAENKQKELLNDVYNSLNGCTVTEMYNKNWSDSPYDGNNASDINNADEKYNLISGEELTGNSSVVELIAGNTSKKYYKISSDTSGNIYLDSANDIESLKKTQSNKILSKTDGVEALRDSSAINFENNIQLVSRFISAIERNTGNDKTASWAPDGAWYNEAAEIYIEVQTSTIDIGFSRVKRTLVNGLAVEQNGKSDMGTKAISCGWKLNIADDEVVAKFNGEDVKLFNGSLLLKSNIFYTTNMSVQDN